MERSESGVESAAPVGNGDNRAGSVLVLLDGPGRAVAPVVHRRLENASRSPHSPHRRRRRSFDFHDFRERRDGFCSWAGALDPLEPDE